MNVTTSGHDVLLCTNDEYLHSDESSYRFTSNLCFLMTPVYLKVPKVDFSPHGVAVVFQI